MIEEAAPDIQALGAVIEDAPLIHYE